MSSSLSIQQLESIHEFPLQSPIKKGKYVIKTSEEKFLQSDDEQVQSETWFQSPPLDLATIKKIDSLQLFAESHDQGFCDDQLAGSWTWFELAILESEHATSPRFKDGIKLVWTSHLNRLETSEYDLVEGALFDSNHALLRLLDEGNVIAVRLCTRFCNWQIYARNGYLVIGVGSEKKHRKPVDYKQTVTEVKNIQAIITEVNDQMQPDGHYKPSLPATLFRADNFTTGHERPLRVLSLDGGGVRGLSSLHLLNAVMSRMAPGKKPCEVFDMIGGTSTGGLIAIMLGRLKMSVDECIKMYTDFMNQIFGSGKSYIGIVAKKRFYSKDILEKIIKDLIHDKLGDRDAPLLDESSDCKIFVMATLKDGPNNRAPVFLRSYSNPLEKSALPNIKLWEAARATSAAPAYFDPIEVNGLKLMDGGLGANNPLGWLWTEILGVFGPARPTNCFLSIGTGISKNQPLDVGFSMVGPLASIATNSEITHILFRAIVNAFAPNAGNKKYWRLNIGEEIPAWEEPMSKYLGLVKWTEKHLDNYTDVGDLDDLKALKKLMELTEDYIKGQKFAIEECARALDVKLE